jgi:hypothetical protein
MLENISTISDFFYLTSDYYGEKTGIFIFERWKNVFCFLL